jgi:gliding motility-associated-like protein
MDVSGCTVSDQIYIEVDDSRSAYAPTAFHPDSDDTNNRFTIYGGSDLSSIKQLLIFDRWGSLMYEGENLMPNDELSGWDGVYQGQDLGTGVFVFSAILVFSDGTEVPLQGDVLLIR